MQKVSQGLSRRSATQSEPLALLDKYLARFFKSTRSVGLSPSVCASLLGLLVLSAFAWVHWHVPRGLNFELVYLLVCAVVGWYGGVRAALVCAVASLAWQFLAERAEAASSGWTLALNSLLRLGAFASVGWLTAELGRLTRVQARTLRERSDTLRKVVAEREQTADWLQQALHVFRQVAENISAVIWVADASRSEIQYVSPEFEEVWGESRQALYDNPGLWLERVHPEDRERVARALASRTARGDYDEEYRVVRSDGSVRWLHERCFPLREHSGTVYRTLGIAEDITDRKRTERLLEAERNLGLGLSSMADLTVAVERLLDIGLQLEGIECGGVYLADTESGEFKLKAHRGMSEPFVGRVRGYSPDAPEVRAAKAGRAIYLRQEQIPRSLRAFWGSEGLSALAVVPLQHHGLVFGMLALGSYHARELLARTRLAIEMLASQVAGALARIRAEDAFRSSDAQLRALINHAPIALLATDAEGRLTFADGRALPALGLGPTPHLGRPAAELFKDYPLALENLRRAAAGEEFTSVLEFADAAFECRYAPLRSGPGQGAGVITVAIDVTERTRLQKEILEITDREQARIGQDIHDGLCQQLIGLAFKLNTLQQGLAAGQRPEGAAAQRACDLLDEAITESRRVARGLYPIRLTTLGLLPALEELAASATERFGIECQCQSQGSPLDCGITAATHLYRIAQEALNNAIKHSGARHVFIRLDPSEGGVALRVRDDGQGLPASRAADSGMGMHIMAYRARLIGGVLEIKSGEDGVEVSCVVPRLSAEPQE